MWLRGFWIEAIVAEKEPVETTPVARTADVGAILAKQETSMATQRTKSISTKVTEAEYDAIVGRAEPLTVSAWARDVLLGSGAT